MKKGSFVLAIAFSLTGCATTFHGNPKVPNGVAGCKAQCESWSMELVGMVAMGEYSDGCICQVPTAAQKTSASAVGGAAAVAGVWIQMQEAERAAQSRMIQAPHR